MKIWGYVKMFAMKVLSDFVGFWKDLGRIVWKYKWYGVAYMALSYYFASGLGYVVGKYLGF